MTTPYSVDLRRKILLALEDDGKSQREIADLFHVSLSFVESLLRQVRATGRIEPEPAPPAARRRASMKRHASVCARGWASNLT